ncbi:MAG: ATP-dependent zinc metalloprotease FtsH [Clostridia bacterium]|nr:ATP-dependent zinc metalloprotease FtsH [Clostridia bacterium]
MKNFLKDFGIYFIIFGIVLVAVALTQNDIVQNKIEQKTYTDVINSMNNGSVSKLAIYSNDTGINVTVRAYIKGEELDENGDPKIVQIIECVVPDVRTFQGEIDNTLKTYPEMIVEPSVVESYDWIVTVLPAVIVGVISIIILFTVLGQAGPGKSASFGKSRARKYNDELKDITFKKVAGLIEEKEQLSELVLFLKNPKKFIDMGARIPKGVLLVGPPGTGKTLLGKAVAGEAGVPFFSISGSDFVEMFVGVGASRVRDLFDEAKKNSPCIVFIDEIDAVGRKRGSGLGGGHDEREQTLNQLLVEMDGFNVNQGVIVLAATNRADILDSALTRPGRFDRTVYVGRPDVKGREQILKVHAANKPIADSVDFETIAKTTAGYTGADLENLMNEAAIIAAKKDKTEIDMHDIGQAFVKTGIGTEKKSKVISEKEKTMTAYHEGGHAILHYILPEVDNVHSVSIIPTGFAGGYTMTKPTEDRQTLSKTYMEQEICALLGGRIAESLKVNDITTGASNDIERATALAHDMVTKYGMSPKLGPINYQSEGNEVFIGRDLGKTQNYGDDVAKVIDEEVRRIIEEQYLIGEKILKEHDAELERLMKELVVREKITGEEFEAIMKGEPLPEFVKVEENYIDDLDIFDRNKDKQITLDDVEKQRLKEEEDREIEEANRE